MSKLSAIEIEKSLLGFLIENGTNTNIVINYLSSDNFYDPKNKMIYKTITALDEKNIEVEYITLVNELNKENALEKIGGAKYITELMKKAGLKSNVTKYAMEIHNFAQLRLVQKNLNDIQNDIQYKKNNINDVINQLGEKVMSITNTSLTKHFQSSLEIINDAIKVLEKRAAGKIISGIQSQYKILDDMTSGFQKGDLVIIASRPSMGKTSFALNIAVNISRTKNVAFFSLEMPAEQLINRVLSSTTGIESNKLRHSKDLNAHEWDKIYHYQKEIGKYKLFIDDTPGLNLSELIWKAKRLSKGKNKPDIIIIDYMQLLSVKGNKHSDNRQAEVAAISNGLKQLARELEIPVISLAQLSRRVEQRESKIPIMSDLRESGSIEQDADIIMFLYRDAYYQMKEEKHHSPETSSLEEVDIIVAKHRNGETGKFSLIFNQSLGKFSSIPKNNS